MKIEMIKVEDLIPYEKNPRHNEASVDKVAASIREFGFKQPIVIDDKNVIVCGHTRLLAAKKLKLQEAPCIRADDLTEQQIRAYRLADNKVAEFADWDYDLLDSEISDIFDIDMSMFGFEDAEEPKEVVEDNFEVVLPEEPKAKLGDIYILGDHRLICGDSCSIDQINNLVGGGGDRLGSYGPAVQHELPGVREYEGPSVKENPERSYVGRSLRGVPARRIYDILYFHEGRCIHLCVL